MSDDTELPIDRRDTTLPSQYNADAVNIERLLSFAEELLTKAGLPRSAAIVEPRYFDPKLTVLAVRLQNPKGPGDGEIERWQSVATGIAAIGVAFVIIEHPLSQS